LKRVLIFAILFILLLVLAFVYLNYSRQVDSSKIILSGVLEADELDLSFMISGRLIEVNVAEGQLVDSGAVIANLESRELAAALDQVTGNYQAIRASISNLEISRETAKRNLLKVEALLQSGGATQTQYDDLSDQIRQLEAQLIQAENNLQAAAAGKELALARLEYAELSTPTNGTVISKMYDAGEVVMPGAPVCTIIDLEDLTVKIYLPEVHLGHIKLGQSVKIQIDSHPDQTFSGWINHISDKAEFTPKNIQTKEERVKQVFAIEVECGSQDGILKPGLPCDVEIPLE